MPRIRYKNIKFSTRTIDKIRRAVEIITEYAQQGYKLTLRQLYYQFVSRCLIKNTMQEYKRIGSIINDARLAGLLDWDAIEEKALGIMIEQGSRRNGMKLSWLGDQLWGKRHMKPQAWCMPAGALIRRMEKKGLVCCLSSSFRGLCWYPTTAGERAVEQHKQKEQP